MGSAVGWNRGAKEKGPHEVKTVEVDKRANGKEL
jgi:hypothetical protein